MTLLHDCERLIREFFPAVSTAWAHVYDSALTFAPQDSALRKCYSPQIKVMGGPKEWNVCSRIIEGHSGWVMSVVYSPDGTRIASGSIDGTMRLWDAVSGAHLNTLEGHSSKVYSVTFSPDGVIIASGSTDGSICLWDAVSGKLWKTFTKSSACVYSVAFSPDGTHIASGSMGGVIRLWDATNGAHLITLEGYSSNFPPLAFSPNGAIIASTSAKGGICLWDVISGKLWKTLGEYPTSVCSVAYSPDGTRIASGLGDYTICMWDAIKWNHWKTLKGHQGIVHSVAFSPKGTTIVSASDDKTIRLWDAGSGAHLVTLEGHSRRVNSVSFSPGGTHIVSGSDDDTIRLWANTQHGIHTKKDSNNVSFIQAAFSGFNIPRFLAGRDHINDSDSLLVLFSPDASVIVSVPMHGSPVLWNAVNGTHLTTLKALSDRDDLTFSHDGTKIVSVSIESLRLWDAVSGRTMKILAGPASGVVFAAFSRDDTCIGSGSADGRVRLWDVISGAHVRTLWGHTERVISVQFSPEGTRIASGSESEIQLWDALRGTPIATIEMGHRFLQSIDFMPDENHLTVALSDGEDWCLDLRPLFDDSGVLKLIKLHDTVPARWLLSSLERRNLTPGAGPTRQWARAYGKIAVREYVNSV